MSCVLTDGAWNSKFLAVFGVGESCLVVGVKAFAGAVLHYLNQRSARTARCPPMDPGLTFFPRG